MIPPLFLPSPTAILTAGWDMLVAGELHQNVLTSLSRIASGYVIGSVCGITIGLFLGFSRWAETILTPIVYSIYPIPKIALLPLIILWLGIGELPKMTIIALGVFFPVVINTFSGVKNVDSTLINAAVSFGASHLSVVRKVILPGALPMIFAGLKLAAGTSLLLLVSAEMIAAQRGIGALILHYGNLMLTTNLMAGVIVLSLLGLIFNRGLQYLERKLIPWK
jgi:NitT/TauT family transport system permease protein